MSTPGVGERIAADAEEATAAAARRVKIESLIKAVLCMSAALQAWLYDGYASSQGARRRHRLEAGGRGAARQAVSRARNTQRLTENRRRMAP
jgi:hypothetical protein